MIEIIGFVAAILSSSAGLFQVIKTLKKGKTEDLSLLMWLAQSSGVTLWLIYALAIGSMPMIASGSFSLLCALILVGMMVKNHLTRLSENLKLK